MSATETNIQWFIARDGRQHGPVSDVELRKLVELAHLKPTDLVWRQGFSDWRTAASVFPIPDTPPTAAPSAPAAPAQPQAAPQTQAPGPAPGSGPMASGPQPITQHGPAPPPAAPIANPGQAPAPNTSFAAAPGPGPSRGLGPALGQQPSQPYAPFGHGQPNVAGRAPGPEPVPTRPLGSPVIPQPGPFGGPGPGPGPAAAPRITTDMRRPSEPSQTTHRRASTRKAPRLALVATALLALMGAGAWLSSQYKDEILGTASTSENGSASKESPNSTAAAAMVPPDRQGSQTAATPVANVVPSTEEMDAKLQARRMWVVIKQQFPERYQQIVTQASRLAAEQKPQSDITAYLVSEIVKIRRENAQHALAASTARHKELAAAFLANLQELSRESGDGCYEFISRGETSAVILSRIEDPARSVEIETQLITIVTAVVEGRAQPSSHPVPVKTDYDVLAGELGRLGWTQADMRLFANPKELAQAPRDRVCSMLKDWFTAHLAIQDPSTQERLLFETLKPVVSG